MFTIGCHLSSARGLQRLGMDALSIQANTFQFFMRNPRGFRAKEIKPPDAEALRRIMEENHIRHPMAHAPYTLNPCSAKENLRKMAQEILADDVSRLEACLPGAYYNLHPGSHGGQGLETGIDQIAFTLNQVIAKGQKTLLLLETMSGQGSEVGGDFNHLGQIIGQVDGPLGVCLDTCHIWAAGYDIVDKLDEVLNQFERIIGLERLKAIHLNDSLGELSSHKDRHAALGQGRIGLPALIRFIRHPAVRHLPFYLETPHDLAGYGREIALLRSLS